MENVVASVVHKHAHNGQRDNLLAVLLHALVDGRALVKVFKPVAGHPLKLFLVFFITILPSLRVFSAGAIRVIFRRLLRARFGRRIAGCDFSLLIGALDEAICACI